MSAVEKLVKRWRLNGATRMEHEQVIYERCADELEAALSAQPRPLPAVDEEMVRRGCEALAARWRSGVPVGPTATEDVRAVLAAALLAAQPASAPVGVEGLAGKIGVHYAQHESCKPGVPFYAFTVGELRAFAAALAQQPAADLYRALFERAMETGREAMDYVQANPDQFGAQAGDDKLAIVCREFLRSQQPAAVDEAWADFGRHVHGLVQRAAEEEWSNRHFASRVAEAAQALAQPQGEG